MRYSKATALASYLTLCTAFNTVPAPTSESDHTDDVHAITPFDGGNIACTIAEPQSPRDVSEGFVGGREARSLPMGRIITNRMVQVNTHFHAGAEHRSEGHYDVPIKSLKPDAGVADTAYVNEGIDYAIDYGDGGYMCDRSGLAAAHLKPYEFEHCEGVAVGFSHELHWVYSSGGSEMGPGLSGVGTRQANPTVVVEATVFQVVNDDSGALDFDLIDGETFQLVGDDSRKVMYVGSTTGKSYDDNTCSPFSITWHIDRDCHLVSARSMDLLCKKMIEMGMGDEAKAHASRDVVLPSLAASELYLYNDFPIFTI